MRCVQVLVCRRTVPAGIKSSVQPQNIRGSPLYAMGEKVMSDDLVHVDDLKRWAGIGQNVKPLRESIGAGDLVTLKSGGPKMVVAERTADKAHCVWHFDNGDSCWQWFPLVVLQVSK